jgi:hypothetical protein
MCRCGWRASPSTSPSLPPSRSSRRVPEVWRFPRGGRLSANSRHQASRCESADSKSSRILAVEAQAEPSHVAAKGCSCEKLLCANSHRFHTRCESIDTALSARQALRAQLAAARAVRSGACPTLRDRASATSLACQTTERPVMANKSTPDAQDSSGVPHHPVARYPKMKAYDGMVPQQATTFSVSGSFREAFSEGCHALVDQGQIVVERGHMVRVL